MTGTTDRGYLEGHAATLEAHKTVTTRRYLVSLSCNMDEIPVRIFDTEDDALDFIKHNPPYPNCPKNELNCPEVENAFKIGERDVGCVHGYELIDFADDRPTQRRLFWWDDEDTEWTPAEGWEVNAFSEIVNNEEKAAREVAKTEGTVS